jgi:RNA polymerase sigma factor (sigma-70 family)
MSARRLPTLTRPLARERARGRDAELVQGAVGGDERCFEAIFQRHHPPLLSYCRHMLGSREEAEDALQQTFMRAHRALGAGNAPRELRPWLYAIARNRCLSTIAARRATDVLGGEEPALTGLTEEVQEREDLRELVRDIGGLPEEQRSALLLAELEDLDHRAIATVLGCPVSKVKALVHQARTTLIAQRDARATPCEEIRAQLSVARGGELRRGPLRRHLKLCEGCRDFRYAVELQRGSLAAILPVLPSAALAARILGPGALHAAAGAGGTAGGAGAAATGAGGGAAGTGAAGGIGAGAIVGGVAAKVAVVGALVVVATAGAVVVPHRLAHASPAGGHVDAAYGSPGAYGSRASDPTALASYTGPTFASFTGTPGATTIAQLTSLAAAGAGGATPKASGTSAGSPRPVGGRAVIASRLRERSRARRRARVLERKRRSRARAKAASAPSPPSCGEEATRAEAASRSRASRANNDVGARDGEA